MFITMLQVLFFYFHQVVRIYIQECGQCEHMQHLITIQQMKNCKNQLAELQYRLNVFMCRSVQLKQ